MFDIRLKDVSVYLGGQFLLKNLQLHMKVNEQWAIAGNSGSGKTTLSKVLSGPLFHRGEIFYSDRNGHPLKPRIILIEQQHVFRNKSNVINFYYQQRFNSTDAEDTHDVETELGIPYDENLYQWVEMFGIGGLLKKPLIQLSNGENKRLQLTKAMKHDPEILILDNPFIGLDKNGRKILEEACEKLIQMGKKILLISSMEELPDFITHVALLDAGSIIKTSTIEEHRKESNRAYVPQFNSSELDALHFNELSAEEIIAMRNVNICYDANIILNNINWTVKKGERWCITGHNGSGKSTLLSLISADNPQAYANEIYLFGKRRGTGESIWDIKKNIGYVSPELHLFFEKGETVFQTVASGLYDTIGLFRHVPPSDREQIDKWISIMQINELREKIMMRLSLGEQRKVMLARALVKSPPLLILDEPCQGLDRNQTEHFKKIIDSICEHTSTTLIYVSHYDADIPSCVHHRLELEKGRIINIT